jgi:DNA modification methylase
MTVRVLEGDCREMLGTLPDASVNCVVTSPPYFGLRDYGTASWEGGDPYCDHKQATARNDGRRAQVGAFHGSAAIDSDKGAMNYRGICGKCGAARVDSQIGLEPTPEEYVAELITVFREVHRVLKNDGTLWLNLGDTYAGGGNGGGGSFASERANWRVVPPRSGQRQKVNGLKAKDLVGIPWRVAFALQADGWYLRQDIIWSKPNPMPESVTDRCTKAHEYVFMLSKSARYFYDADAVAEPAIYSGLTGQDESGFKNAANFAGFNDRWDAMEKAEQCSGTRNKRSVWTIATRPYSEAHFATMAPELAETCVKAGTRPGDTVLDPFGGAGTTGLVADRLNRNAILIELNPEYAALARDRVAADAGMFGEVA